MSQKIQTISLIFLTGCVAVLFYLQFNTKSERNVGFVRSQELIYQYAGMLDAMEKFEREEQEWASNLDTLKSDYERSVSQYEQIKPSLSEDQLAQQEQLLQYQYNNCLKYAQDMEEGLQNRELEILEGVFNQVNAFSADFAVENELDLLVTTGSSGNVLYGSDQLDYTEELLTYINSKYEGNE